MNGKKARRLRGLAGIIAQVDNKIVNENINIVPMKSGQYVMNDDGVFVEEMIPKTTYETKYVDECPRRIYKELKKGVSK